MRLILCVSEEMHSLLPLSLNLRGWGPRIPEDCHVKSEHEGNRTEGGVILEMCF